MLLRSVYKKVPIHQSQLVDESFLLLTMFICLDLAELDIPDTIKLDFPDPSNILNFNVTIHPDEGILSP